MKLKAPLFSMLLLSAVWVAAQTSSPSSTSPAGSASGETTQSSPAGANSQTSTPSTAPETPSTNPQTPGIAPQSPATSSQTPGASPSNPGTTGQTTPGTAPEQNAAPSTTAPSATTPSATALAAQGSGITGCLAGSPIAGTYTLTDKSGNAYKLTGNLNAVRTLIGNEVQVTGQEGSGMGSNANASTAGTSATASSGNSGMSSTASTGATKEFNVTSATKVADQCTSGSATPSPAPGPTARTHETKAAPVMMAALQTGSAGSTRARPAGGGAGSAAGPAPRAQFRQATSSP